MLVSLVKEVSINVEELDKRIRKEIGKLEVQPKDLDKFIVSEIAMYLDNRLIYGFDCYDVYISDFTNEKSVVMDIYKELPIREYEKEVYKLPINDSE